MAKFTAPTQQEVQLYFTELGIKNAKYESEKFIDTYEMCGWVTGKTRKPMVSWKAACRNWIRNLKDWGKYEPIKKVVPLPKGGYIRTEETLYDHSEEISRMLKETTDKLRIPAQTDFGSRQQEIQKFIADNTTYHNGVPLTDLLPTREGE